MGMTGNQLVGGTGGKPVVFVKPEAQALDLSAVKQPESVQVELPEMKQVVIPKQSDAKTLAAQEIQRLIAGLYGRKGALEAGIRKAEAEQTAIDLQIEGLRQALKALGVEVGPIPPVWEKTAPEMRVEPVVEQVEISRKTGKAKIKRRVSKFRATEPGSLELAVMLLEDQKGEPLHVQAICDGIGIERRNKRGRSSMSAQLAMAAKRAQQGLEKVAVATYRINRQQAS